MYSTEAEVRTRAVTSLIDVDTSKFPPAISWADNFIDARLAGVYTVPFSPTPNIIKEISADLAAYFVLFEEHIAGAENVPIGSALELKTRATEMLDLLVSGAASIPVTDPLVAPSAGAGILTNFSSPSLVSTFDQVNRPNSNAIPFAPMWGVRSVY